MPPLERTPRLASVAPDRPSSRVRSDGLEPEVYGMCADWVHWCRTRARLGAPRLNLGSSIEQFHRVHATAGDERSGLFNQHLALFNWCIVHHEDQIARAMFEAHFLKRQQQIKRLAAEYGKSRATWYRTVNAFARSAYRQFELKAEEAGLHA